MMPIIDQASLIGKRPSNEDAHIFVENLDGKDKKKAQINAYGVFDGHGGKFVSKFLSQHLPKIMCSDKMQYPLRKSLVTYIFNFLQDKLKEEHRKKCEETGSTCLFVAHFRQNNNDYINVINIGDSKCVICRNNIALPLSIEHRP